MASVQFDAVKINLAADKSQSMSFRFGTGLRVQPDVNLSTTLYAAGNVRRVRTPGFVVKWSTTLRAVEPGDVALLAFDATNGGWLGEPVWLRDFTGRRLYGYWDNVSVADHGYDTNADVGLTFTSITFTGAFE